MIKSVLLGTHWQQHMRTVLILLITLRAPSPELIKTKICMINRHKA